MDLESLKYTLIVKTKFVRKTVYEDHLKAQFEREMVILIPEHNDECGRFFRAWLPDTTDEYYELGVEIGSPVFSPSRVSIHRAPHPYSDSHFLFVMSKGVEEDLLRQPEGKRLQVIILPQSSEEILDHAKDSSQGNYHTVEA